MRLVIALLLTAAPISAQDTDLCRVQGPRTIRGVVVDTLGQAIDSGSVMLNRRIQAQGSSLLQRCSTPIGPDGSFEFVGMVSDSLVVVANAGWPTTGTGRIPLGRGDVQIQVTVTTPPARVRDFADYDDRPAALEGPVGIPGCYWLGHVRGPARTIELRDDGSVDWGNERSEPYFRWERRSPSSIRAYIWDSEGFGWAGFTMDLTPPVDWSAIPTLFESKTDAVIRPNEWESFVTRVPCVSAPRLGRGVEARPGGPAAVQDRTVGVVTC
jgi:hypothetical protein